MMRGLPDAVAHMARKAVVHTDDYHSSFFRSSAPQNIHIPKKASLICFWMKIILISVDLTQVKCC